jgi:hypothetical protein
MTIIIPIICIIIFIINRLVSVFSFSSVQVVVDVVVGKATTTKSLLLCSMQPLSKTSFVVAVVVVVAPHAVLLVITRCWITVEIVEWDGWMDEWMIHTKINPYPAVHVLNHQIQVLNRDDDDDDENDVTRVRSKTCTIDHRRKATHEP